MVFRKMYTCTRSLHDYKIHTGCLRKIGVRLSYKKRWPQARADNQGGQNSHDFEMRLYQQKMKGYKSDFWFLCIFITKFKPKRQK